MSRHQDVRNLDVHEVLDDYEGYSDEEENELSPEDQALMKQGAAEVKAALGMEASKVTTTQIEEALWHYYYDVDKSVAYLISKFIDPPKKPQKIAPKENGKPPPFACPCLDLSAPSKIALYPRLGVRRACSMADARPSEPLSCSLLPRSSLTVRQGGECPRISPLLFGGSPGTAGPLSYVFRDMPWGNIPKGRETVFIPPPRPRGGLLGGSGSGSKMSKLQQLAAARKKKAEEKGAQDKVEQTRSQMSSLSVDESSRNKENQSLAGAFGKRLKTSESTAEGRNPLAVVEPSRPGATQPPENIPSQKDLVVGISSPVALEIAQPSAFAQTLFGGSSDTPKRKRLEFFPLPYMDSAPSAMDAFSRPSPDDVVMAAQAKGSLLGKSKH